MKKLTRPQIEKKLKNNGHFTYEYNPITKYMRIFALTFGKNKRNMICGIDMPYILELIAGHHWNICMRDDCPCIVVEF